MAAVSTTDTLTVPDYAPSDWHVQWVASNWDWHDLTEDELRCLWVLERSLEGRGMRFYHLPASPRPERLNSGQGFIFRVDELGSWDAEGLAELTVASFTARVRVNLSARMVWMNPERDYECVGWHEDLEYDEVCDSLIETAVMAVQLSPRRPGGDLYTRHPGVGHITDLIEQYARSQESVHASRG